MRITSGGPWRSKSSARTRATSFAVYAPTSRAVVRYGTAASDAMSAIRCAGRRPMYFWSMLRSTPGSGTSTGQHLAIRSRSSPVITFRLTRAACRRETPTVRGSALAPHSPRRSRSTLTGASRFASDSSRPDRGPRFLQITA